MKLKIYDYLKQHPFQKRIVKWWIKMGLPIPEKLKRQIANQIHAEMITRLMEVVVLQGSLNFEQAMQSHYELGKEMAPIVSDLLSIDANDARSLTKVVDFINLLLDIKGCEVKKNKGVVIRHETCCFLSEQLSMKKAPYYCKLYQSMYKGTLDGLNPNAKANDLKIMQSKGADYCEIVTSIDKSPSDNIG